MSSNQNTNPIVIDSDDDNVPTITGVSKVPNSSKSPSEPKPIVIDSAGDLHLVVGTKKRVFIVDSRALLRCSNVWKDIIQAPNDASNEEKGMWEISLDLAAPNYGGAKVEKIEPLKVLLYAVHGRLNMIPNAPKLSDFSSILILTNRFEMVPIMRGHIREWYALMKRTTDGLRVRILHELRITWEYGNVDDFRQVANLFVWHSEVDEDARLLRAEPERETTAPLAEDEPIKVTGILEAVTKRRLVILRSALRELQEKIELLYGKKSAPLEGQQSVRFSCKQGNKKNDECDAFYLGLLVRALMSEDINAHNLPTAESIKESLHSFQDRLDRVYDAISNKEHKGHAKCNPMEEIVTDLKSKRDNCNLKLTREQTDHFKEQAMKMGPKNIKGWGSIA